MADHFITPAQVADRLVMSRSTVYDRIRTGQWEATKVGERLYRFSPAQYAAITDQHTRPSAKPNRARLRDALKKIA